jgi:hypothetical protein
MNVTFVGQQRKLEELMCLQYEPVCHSPGSQTMHTLVAGEQWPGWKITAQQRALNMARREEGRKAGQLEYITALLCARMASIYPQSTLSPTLEAKK